MSLPLPSGDWTMDPVHSSIAFAARHLGISMIRGRFITAEATLSVGDTLEDTSLTAEVDLSSVDTGNADRNGHLQSTDFFSVETKPKMSFASTSIEDLGDNRYRVEGNLTLNDHTQAESLEASFAGTEANPIDGSTRAGFLASGRIDRTDYGLNWNVPLEAGGFMVSDKIDITIDTQLVGPSAD